MAKAKSAGRSVVALDRSPSQLLHRAQQLALDIYAQEFGAGGITQRQFALLAAVADNEGANQSDLVRITGIDRSTLADMAARMISKGLLGRARSETDARANAVRLTDKGRGVLEDARPKMARADGRLLKLLASDKRASLPVLLRELIRGADGLDSNAAVPPPARPARAPAKKPAAKKPAAKKPAKKPAAKKPAARKPAARKPAARKPASRRRGR